MKPILYTILICTSILACSRYPAGVEETLSQAGRNRGELKKVLRHYREHPAKGKIHIQCVHPETEPTCTPQEC